jgi:hypothetical protein
LTGFNHRQQIIQKLSCRRTEFIIQRPCGILKIDVDFLLPDDITGIRLVNHEMERYPRLMLTFNQHPVYRTPPTVCRKERSMKIHGTQTWNIENGPADHFPVIYRKNDVRFQGCYFIYPLRRIDTFRSITGNIMFQRPVLHGTEPAVFLRIVFMGKNSGNFKIMLKQGIKSRNSHIVIG